MWHLDVVWWEIHVSGESFTSTYRLCHWSYRSWAVGHFCCHGNSLSTTTPQVFLQSYSPAPLSPASVFAGALSSLGEHLTFALAKLHGVPVGQFLYPLWGAALLPLTYHPVCPISTLVVWGQCHCECVLHHQLDTDKDIKWDRF